MSLTHYIKLLIISCFIQKSLMDCGCNKAKREAQKDPDIGQRLVDLIQHEESEEELQQQMSLIPEGEYKIGTKQPIFASDHENERKVYVNQFYMDKYQVSNADFENFVIETGYITEAQEFGDSFVFQSFVEDDVKEKYKDFRVAAAPWWYKINGTSWIHPEGTGSNINDRMNHPVVHVSYKDATEYCKWRNKRLPSEAEWEVACRGGREGKLFPWGNKLMPNGEHWMNIWQGEFPETNTGNDGYIGRNPVDKFKQNKYEIYNIVGNVWEWTSDLWDEKEDGQPNPNRVRKGGSYLCHESYCYRYRCAARSQNTEDSSADNLGFRCVKDFL